MLRRIKKDVENELSDKIEILMYCPLTSRQKMLYSGNKIFIFNQLKSVIKWFNFSFKEKDSY